MEALACYSYYELKDVYLNLVLKDKYSKDENMERMIDLCLAHPKTEFSYMASYIFGTELFFCTVWNGRNLAAWMQTHKRVYEAKFEELYDALRENYN